MIMQGGGNDFQMVVTNIFRNYFAKDIGCYLSWTGNSADPKNRKLPLHNSYFIKILTCK